MLMHALCEVYEHPPGMGAEGDLETIGGDKACHADKHPEKKQRSYEPGDLDKYSAFYAEYALLCSCCLFDGTVRPVRCSQ